MANHLFEYDVAVSFAPEDRAVADELASAFRAKKLKVHLDEVKAMQGVGGNFVTHIAELYRTRAQFCILLISQHYPLKRWTHEERTAAREHALRDADEYILPVRLDETNVPGVMEARGYRELREHPMESIADSLKQKISQSRDRSGPPSQSHDLRSGNVPKTD